MVKLYKILLLILTYSTGVNSAISQNPLRWLPAENIIELNTSADEYAPSWNKFEQRLYFNIESNNQTSFLTTTLEKSGFGKPQKLRGELNTSRHNLSYITFIDAENAFVSAFRARKSYPVANIFKTNFAVNRWSQPYLYDDLISDAFTSQLTLSPNKRTIVFVSSRDNIAGNTDLWMGYLDDNGNCLSIIKLDEINSIGNEITPFLASDDTLYFASDGHGGPGGFDVFYSIFSEGRWQRPRQVESVNTEFNETDFIILPNGNAVFASDRPGGAGGLDLYLGRHIKQEQLSATRKDILLALSAQVTSLMASEVYSFYLLPGTVPTESGIGEIKLEPPVIELRIDSRPTGITAPWEIILNISGRKIKTLYNGTELPANVMIDLSQYSDVIFNSDSLLIEVNPLNQDFNTASIKFNVVRNSFRERLAVNMNNTEYIVYFIDAEDLKDNYKNNSNSYIINEILTGKSEKGSIIIEYSEKAKNFNLAQNVKSYLESINEFKNNDFSIKLSSDSNLDLNNNNLIRVLVERKY